KSVQITKDKNPEIVNGQEVHRREFGIEKGIFWSPKGNALAFYRKDESMVTDYPLVDISTRIATLKNIKYPMAGMKSHEVTLGVYNINTKETVFLNTGEPKEQYLTNIVWSPDEQSVFIAVLNREQNHMQLKEYDATTGEFVKILFEEKNDKYIEPEHSMVFLESDSDKFIWQSRNGGFNHVYLYNTDGDLIKQITEGNFEVSSVIGFNKNDKDLFYVSTEESAIERHIYKVNLKTGKKTKLTDISGSHNAKFNTSYKYFIDSYSSTEIPKKIDIVSVNGKVEQNILTSKNPLKEYNIGEMSISTIKAADGVTDLYYRLIKPTNFDPNKKYPAIIYVYGGPHAQLVENRWLGGARMWQYYMAQKGYVMLTVDNRGSANRGLEFENVIHRQLGVNEIADQMKGVELLNSLGYVDSERIGVHGWSFGGFLTTSLMLKKADTFKVGVAGGPVIDWKYYEIMYGERYMDTPQENPEGYKENNLKNYVSNLKGKLLIVHGAIDNTVVWQNSLSFVRECVKQDVLLDYFVYPRHEHNVRGMNRVHLMKKVTQYFDDFL
ncbi:MAG: DPP IV N-terminal domain-containing protein, partial [Bacteroidota bacterium]|nr:DPP IV N-terminal domain-containing protein [Bacteroidota bacterium]